MKAPLKILAAALYLWAMDAGIARAETRTWTAADGRTVEAEFKGVTGTGAEVKVLLAISGRSAIPFPLSGLSEADRKWVEEKLKNPVPAAPAADEDGGGAKAILGKWEGYMATSDGAPQGDLHLEITEDLITATNPGGQLMGTGTYKLRGGGKVMRIDTTGTAGQYEGKDYEGIITVEGKTLKWCSTNDNHPARRPTELKTNMQQNHFLMALFQVCRANLSPF